MSSIKSLKPSANIPAELLTEPQDVQPSPDSSAPDVPRLAVRCDGRVLLSLTDLENVDLTGRDLWLGLVLTEAETASIYARLNIEEAASPTVAHLRALDKQRKSPSPKADNDDESGNSDK